MSSNRLELGYSKSQKVMMGLVYPLLFGIGGILTLWYATNITDYPDDKFRMLLGSGLICWLPFFAFLLLIPKVLTNKSRIIIDERGITDNQRRKTLTIPWRDISEISFPYRRVGRYTSDYIFSIKLKDPQEYHSRIPFLHRLNRRLTSDAGDYEISVYIFKGGAPAVYWHLVKLQEKGLISPELTIEKTNFDRYS